MVASLGVVLLAALPILAPAPEALPGRPGVLDTGLRRALEQAGDRPEPVRFLARVATPAAAEGFVREVRRLGGHALRVTPELLSATLPPDRLAALAAHPALVRAELSRPHPPALDVSVPETGADRVRVGEGLEAPVTGRGVVLGLVDTGLDWRHPTFAGDDGEVRVQAMWDQTRAEGTPPPGYDRGELCDRQDILTGGCHPLDLIGHGSHVAATAGGRDRTYRGMAPDVDFVVVRSLDFADLGASARWIFETAEALGAPAVINMSLGGHWGAHDGTSLEEQALDDLLGPGRILVVAAGNDGGSRVHLGYDLGESPGRTAIHVAPGFNGTEAVIDLWAQPGTDLELALTLLDGDGTAVAGTDFLAPGEEALAALEAFGSAQIYWEPGGAFNGKDRAMLYLRPAADWVDGGDRELVLEVRGQGRFDAWIAGTGWVGAAAAFGDRTGGDRRPGDDRSTVAIPGTTPGAITVAAYDTRGSWTDAQGIPFTDAQVQLGGLAFFSSQGPTAGEAVTGLKPELAAPGQWIAAPFGQNTPSFTDSVFLDEDIVAMRGTSMATPHVAGAVALLLEVRPELTPDEVKALLVESARRDGFTGAEAGPGWGHGKLDAYGAVHLLVGQPPADGEAPGCGCAAGTSAPVGAAALVVLLWAAWISRRS